MNGNSSYMVRLEINTYSMNVNELRRIENLECASPYELRKRSLPHWVSGPLQQGTLANGRLRSCPLDGRMPHFAVCAPVP